MCLFRISKASRSDGCQATCSFSTEKKLTVTTNIISTEIFCGVLQCLQTGTIVFLLSPLCILVSVPPLFPSSPPSVPPSSLTSSLSPRFALLHLPLWRRGGSEKMGVEVVGWCLGIEQKGAWLPVCLGALNESMIHGTRGSHRDRIRGALSKHSPETGKRYLICPPRQQLPLRVCTHAHVCLCAGERASFSTSLQQEQDTKTLISDEVRAFYCGIFCFLAQAL